MIWFLGLIQGIGVFMSMTAFALLLLSMVWIGWRRNLRRWAATLLIIGSIMAVSAMVIKPIYSFITRNSNSENTQTSSEKPKSEDPDVTKAVDQANADVKTSAGETLAAPVKPADPSQSWIIPSAHAGYFMTDTGVIDGSTVYLPGVHAIRPGGKVYLVDTSPTNVLFNEESGEDGVFDAVTKDGKVVKVCIGLTWLIVPENLPYFKNRLGPNTRYTPIFYDIVRSSVRTVLSKKRWDDKSIVDREQLSRDIQQELDQNTEQHFRRLGLGDRSNNIMKYGQISLRTIHFESN